MVVALPIDHPLTKREKISLLTYVMRICVLYRRSSGQAYMTRFYIVAIKRF